MNIWNSRLVKLIVLGVLFLVISANTFGQTKAVSYHTKLQQERSFEAWEKEQPSKRIRAVNSAVKQSKDVKGKNNSKSKLRRKENRKRKQIIK